MITNKQRGVSLVELMVSVTIGLILMAGVLSIFLSSKMTYFTNEKMARLQENGRVALNLVSHDVRAAGYSGCSRTMTFNNALNNANTLLWNFSRPLQGFENTGAGAWTPALGITLNPAPIDNSDVIVSRTVRRDTTAMRVNAATVNLQTEPTVVDMGRTMPVGEIAMITDCQAASVFQVTGWTDAGATSTIQHATGGTDPGNSTDSLMQMYPAGARVTSLQTLIYYVGIDPATNEPALFRQTGSAQPADLMIEGVEALQIAYGRDTTGDRVADEYVSASGVTNWDNVMSVNFALLVRSPEEGTDRDGKTYQLLAAGLGGRTLGPFNDRRSRLLFTSTIALRNRAL